MGIGDSTPSDLRGRKGAPLKHSGPLTHTCTCACGMCTCGVRGTYAQRRGGARARAVERQRPHSVRNAAVRTERSSGEEPSARRSWASSGAGSAGWPLSVRSRNVCDVTR